MAAAVILLTVIAVYAAEDSALFILEDRKTGEVYEHFPVNERDAFSVTFVHSVNKTPVSDLYEIDGTSIRMTGTIYYDFGAGVPTELEDGQQLTIGEHGEMIISGMDLSIPDLIYVVGTVSDHVLKIHDTEYSLTELCGRNSAVRFYVRPATLSEKLFH